MRSSKSLKSVGSVGSVSLRKSQTSETQNPYFLSSRLPKQKSTFKLKINNDIETQLGKAFSRLKRIQSQIKEESKKTIPKKIKSDLNDLFALEDNLKWKDRQIKKISVQMKEMKLFKRKQQKDLKQQKRELQSPYNSDYLLHKNQEQMRLLKKTLEQLTKMYNQKLNNYQLKKQKVNQLSQKYQQMNRAKGIESMSYQQYMNQQQALKQTKSTLSKMSEFSKKLTNMTVKQIVNSPYSCQQLQHTQQNLLELKNRKEILEGSLRTTKRKNQKEVLQLKQTLQQLVEHNQTLQTKCYQKHKQKQTIYQLKKY